jgi:DNA-binding response OmpR family regulator
VELAVVESDMPDLPGEEMVAAIRSSPNAAGVPIILLSSKAFVFDIERFLKLGVDRCLSKPVTLSEVAVTVRRLIDESRPALSRAQGPA